MRRPIDRPIKVSGDRASHAEYGVGPATDYALPSGAAIIAPFDAALSQWYSPTGGETLVLTRGNGDTVTVQHIHDLASGRAREGDPVALVDGWDDDHGTAWTGPHAHVWVTLADGTRLSFEEYIDHLGGTPAAIGTIAQPTITGLAGKETDMPLNTADEYVIRRVVADMQADALAARKTINALYREIFNRDADTAGLDYWSLKLVARGEAWVRAQLTALQQAGAA